MTRIQLKDNSAVSNLSILNDFRFRVLSDGGTFEGASYLIDFLSEINDFNSSSGFLDLADGVNFPISLSFADIKEPGKRSGGFSKVIELEGTTNNENVIGKHFDVDLTSGTFDRNKKTSCTVIQNGTEIFKGYIQLVEVVRKNELQSTNRKSVVYKVNVFDDVSNFFISMSDKELTELDFSDLSHVFNRQAIIDSWSNTEGYIYPQYAKDDNVYTLRDFKPAIFEYEYFKRIFASNGYTFEFNDYNDEFIRLDKRFIPTNVDNQSSEFLDIVKQSYKVIGVDDSLDFIIDKTQIQSRGWLPMYNFLSANALNSYANSVGSRVELDTIFSDGQDQYNNVNHTIVNKGGNSKTFTYNTNYEYDVKVRGLESVGSTATEWGVYFNTPNDARKVEFCLSLVVQSVTDNSKVAIIDAGTSVFTALNDGNFITFASGWQSLGVGSNASTVNLGLFDDNEAVDFHALMFAKYYDSSGNLIANNQIFNSLSTQPSNINNQLVLLPCQFMDTSVASPVWLEFDIEITNLRIDAVQDIETLTKDSNVDMSLFIPKKIKQKDLISSIAKSYNLIFSTDPDNDRNIIVKTRDKYYDQGLEWDWSSKLDESQNNNITFLSNDAKREQRYAYKSDKDVINQAFQDKFNITYGETQIRLDNEYIISENKRELIYSPTPNVDSGLGVPLPSINGISPQTNLRVLLSNGVKTVYQYPFYDDILTNIDEVQFVSSYLDNSMFDNDVTPNFSICFDAPKGLFHSFQTGQTSNYLYNLHHKRELSTINSGKLLSAYFNLTEADFQKLSKRLDYKIFIKDNGWFYISKIHNYNGNVRTLTKVDLVTADDATALKFKVPKPVIGIDFNDDVSNIFFSNVNYDTNIFIGGKSVSVNGKYNLILGNNSKIIGDSNTVYSDDVTVVGSDNIVQKGMNNSKVVGNTQSIEKTGGYIDEKNISELGHTIYKVGLTQTALEAPNIIEYINNVGNITTSRDSIGVYRLRGLPDLTTLKNEINISTDFLTSTQLIKLSFSGNDLLVSTYNSGSLADSILTSNNILTIKTFK